MRRLRPNSTRSRIYEYLLANPSGKLGLELANMQSVWGTDRASISRVLLDMVNEGLFISRRTGGRGEKNRPAFVYFALTNSDITFNDFKQVWYHSSYFSTVDRPTPTPRRNIPQADVFAQIGNLLRPENANSFVLQDFGPRGSVAQVIENDTVVLVRVTTESLRAEIVKLIDDKAKISDVIKAYENYLKA